MNRTILMIGALVVIALLGLGIYWNVSNRNVTPESTQNLQQVETVTQAQSLEDFLSTTNNQQCSFTDMEADTSGTLYVANGQLRGDFTSMTNGDQVVAHVVSNNQEVYLWMDGVAEGYKTSLDSISDISDDLPIGDIVNPDSNVKYECTPWSVDETKFELPEIEFNDLTSLIENVGGNESNALQCAACDSLSGEAQTQCRAALSCN